MNTDFIKWLCEKAEGFEENYKNYLGAAKANTGLYVDTPHDSFKIGQNEPLWRNVYYPLLLQRAIEGVNRKFNKSRNYRIRIDEIGVRVLDGWETELRYWGTSPDIDRSKEHCLKYIWEQENEGC